ncbi:hypothetical protein BCV72DRAFT_327740 [Rhizopus microsporus var. microsporus]|uniref:PH domain-containing protein n=2 Tax=Rhizopus microsporus TaxID=58291 RepID=A0A2G4SF77_RHIZD|nr:uncharacterized protein RHIMIDRAFT_249259 [Rhizopus microsporus ATCC 52813]ORE06886.1 hypothetical protein BCV72DRAFT_327740 [Rhizopus microsporus var. microsporus]PHZ07427.1 hypothetical protein RHIMIDRAFT_249259 [Rhizopus microsporus ATCC 52813]
MISSSEEASLVNGMNNVQLQDYNHEAPAFSGGHKDDDDDRPLSFQRAPNYPRPISVRNMAVRNTTRPANFIKPVPQFLQNNVPAPSDMASVQKLYENYSQKVYLEGYVYKKNDLTVDGRPLGENDWTKWYMELCGPVLTLWEDIEGDEIIPQFINITDSKVEIYSEKDNIFSLNSAGQNRFLFNAIEYEMLLKWICSIRLSCFECSKLQEIYTRRLITRSTFNDLLSKPQTKMEGYVQVRLSGTTEWQRYWLNISEKSKKLFNKSKDASISFYESKKSKSPLYAMTQVLQAYVIYPESPQLMEVSTIFKIEGIINNEYSTALVMASSTKELAQWIITIFDSFKIYGRPSQLLNDTTNAQSLNFGESPDSSLFLDLQDVFMHVDVINQKLLDNKAQFSDILLQKLNARQQQQQQQQQQPMRQFGLIHQIPNQRASTPLLNFNQQPTQHHAIYASDEGEEEEEEDEEESDSDDSVFAKKKQSISKSQEIETTNNIKKETPLSSNTSLPIKETKKAEPFDTDEDSEEDESDVDTKPKSQPKKPRPKATQTQISDSEEEEEEQEEEGYSDSDDDIPIHQSRQTLYYNQHHPQGEEYYDEMYDTQQYYSNGYPIMTEDGPVIPQLGDNFATQNSLLDTFRPDHPSARDQEGYARATGQPLIQVPNKPPEPRAGLVGMISQIEHEKKQKEANKSRLLDKEGILQRERERYLMEQRAQQQSMQQPQHSMMQPPMMGMMNQPMMNMPQMPMMTGQMPMMGLMGQPMMYPMMNMPMMPMMMDPHMSMMLMQQQYSQYNPMWSQSQMFANSRFTNSVHEDDDEDDDVPLGAKESPAPRQQQKQ